MIAAVSSGGAPGYENLGGYFLGGGSAVRQPVGGVPSAPAPSARMETRPGQQPPGALASVPTSSQKPGNREGNQRIPYARFQFEWQEYDGCGDDLHTGDVCFVHKMSQAMGRGFNRSIKVTSLPVLNKMLSAAVAGVTTLDIDGDPTLASRILGVRKAQYKGDVAARESELACLEMQKEHMLQVDGSVLKSVTDRIDASQLALDSAKADLKDIEDGKGVPTMDRLRPFCDWRAVTALDEWTLDGVVINVDDEVEPEDKFYPKTRRSDGILVNACVQGPTPMRNTPEGADRWYDGSRGPLQHVDGNLQIMDKVFVGLVASPEVYAVASNGANSFRQRYRFKYQLFTGCQFSRAALGNGPQDLNINKLWGAWRVGSVMDTSLSRDLDRMMQINVCVEWWSAEQLWTVFGTEEEENSEDEDESALPTVSANLGQGGLGVIVAPSSYPA